MSAERLDVLSDDDGDDASLFSQIAGDLHERGYFIRPAALPPALAGALMAHQQAMHAATFHDAGIGRGDNWLKNDFVRTDEIAWIDGTSAAGRQWLDWTGRLQRYLNRRLFLGLFSFESHFAHYAPGGFYKRHVDAFRGNTSRVLTVVTYLNPDWTLADGGELVLYRDADDRTGLRVLPMLGTLVVFLSESFPHEVLPSRRDRFSIAGWYRVNASVSERVDPPS